MSGEAGWKTAGLRIRRDSCARSHAGGRVLRLNVERRSRLVQRKARRRLGQRIHSGPRQRQSLRTRFYLLPCNRHSLQHHFVGSRRFLVLGLIVTLPTAVSASLACASESKHSGGTQRWHGASSWQGYTFDHRTFRTLLEHRTSETPPSCPTFPVRRLLRKTCGIDLSIKSSHQLYRINDDLL